MATPTTPETQQVSDRIRSLTDALTPAEGRVAQVVLADPAGVIHLSVTELAAAAGSSEATVVRFCRRLGYQGYQELKLRLARETGPADALFSDDAAGPDNVLAAVMRESALAFQTAIGNIDPGPVEEVARLMTDARRVLFVAVGTSAPIASDAAYRLTTLGLDAQAPPDVHVQHVTAGLLGPTDLCVTVSHTGATAESLAATRAATAAGATTVALTSFVRSPLTDVADHVIVAGSAETDFRVEAMTSRLLHIAVLDAIFVLIARSGDRYTESLERTSRVLIEHRM